MEGLSVLMGTSSLMLFLIIASLFSISVIAFVGVVSLAFKDEVLDSILLCRVGFAACALIGGAFLHLLPETVERSTSMNIFLVLSLGFLLFGFMFMHFVKLYFLH